MSQRTLGEVLDDISPLVQAVSKAQREWLLDMRAKLPNGPLSEESFIALVAIANAYGAALMRHGVNPQALAQLSEVGAYVAGGIQMEDAANIMPEAQA